MLITFMKRKLLHETHLFIVEGVLLFFLFVARSSLFPVLERRQ